MARIVDGTEMNMIGDKLRALRTANGWSQQAVSDKLEMLAIYVCRGSISRIEDKQRTVTDIELYGLSQVFHVPVTTSFQNNKAAADVPEARQRLFSFATCKICTTFRLSNTRERSGSRVCSPRAPRCTGRFAEELVRCRRLPHESLHHLVCLRAAGAAKMELLQNTP